MVDKEDNAENLFHVIAAKNTASWVTRIDNNQTTWINSLLMSNIEVCLNS